jgi:hypothetical protein
VLAGSRRQSLSDCQRLAIATNRLGERITASPAVSGNELFYRTDSHVYCIANLSAN